MREGLPRALALAGALLVTACDEPDARPATGPRADLRHVDLAELRSLVAGRPALINLWATWCPPCIAELPALMAAANAQKDVTVLVLSTDKEDPATLAPKLGAIARKVGVPPPWFVFDGDAREYTELKKWLAIGNAVPATAALRGDGNVVASHTGELGREQFDELIEKAAR